MASGFFAILDDIAALMDDVAVSAKVATQKTAGILGDDLAVNAEKATGFLSSRELPVLWKITKGSFLNKVIIIPIVFLLQVYMPIAITIVLLAGGFYLAYEGVEKIIEWIFHKSKKGEEVISNNENDINVEKNKIKSAISTDFILSIEIVIIALSTVMGKSLQTQILTVSVVAILATVGVYGIVALIVRMDDAGFKLIKKSKGKGFLASLGNVLVKALPVIIKVLAVVGTIALLLVSGGIFDEKIHHYQPTIAAYWTSFPSTLVHLVLGLIGGLIAVVILSSIKKISGLFIKSK